MNCPLCGTQLNQYKKINKNKYYLCNSCFLLFLDPSVHPTLEKCIKRYKEHNNDPQSQIYRSYLWKIVEPCLKWIDKDSRILDYGSGPTKGMETLLSEKDLNIESYDPFFFPIQPSGKYKVIILNEVIEHLKEPNEELHRIKTLLEEDGILLIGTNLWDEKINLETWHYLRDPTHICIYHSKSFDFITNQHQWRVLQENHIRNQALYFLN